jgi:hypothetical protein
MNTKLPLRIVTILLAFLFLLSAVLNLAYKITIAGSTLAFTSPSASIAEFEVVIGTLLVVAFALSNLYVYGGAYLLASVGIAEGLLTSSVQGLARGIHEAMIPFLAVGWLLLILAARKSYIAKQRELQKRRQIITILQFFVGGLVTLGGTAFARSGTYPVGTLLGSIHLAVGIAGLFGGYVYIKRKTWSANFLIWINAITIAYSTFAETLAEIYAYLPPGINDALIGTILAVVASIAILFLISVNRSSRNLHEAKATKQVSA